MLPISESPNIATRSGASAVGTRRGGSVVVVGTGTAVVVVVAISAASLSSSPGATVASWRVVAVGPATSISAPAAEVGRSSLSVSSASHRRGRCSPRAWLTSWIGRVTSRAASRPVPNGRLLGDLHEGVGAQQGGEQQRGEHRHDDPTGRNRAVPVRLDQRRPAPARRRVGRRLVELGVVEDVMGGHIVADTDRVRTGSR